MRCDECRESVVRDGAAGAGAVEHAAQCAECRAWIDREVSTMSVLQRAGAAWREAPTAIAAAPRRRGVGRWAAAAAVLALVAGGVYATLKPSPASAMGVMLTHLKSGGSVRFRIESVGPQRQSGMFYAQGGRVRIDADEGFAYVVDAERGERVVLMPARHELVRGDRPSGMIDFYGLLVSLGGARRVEELGVRELDGRLAEVFRAQLPPEMDAAPGEAAMVWLDVETRLPLRVEIPTASCATATLRDFAFDEVFAPDLFDVNPPGYTERPAEATTPALGRDMALKLRNIGMAFHMFMAEHDGAVPERIEDLAPFLAADGLKSLRRPDEAIGYIYVKPALPLNSSAVLAYERFAEQSEHVWVLAVDGHVELKTRAALRDLLR